jgi:hypothetical protein
MTNHSHFFQIPMKLKLGICAVVSALAIALLINACKDTTTTPNTTPTSDAVDYSFVVMGCNRLDKADTAGVASTANIVQFNRSMTDIAALSPKPDYVFFAGDMVLGYTADSNKLASELNGWEALYATTPVAAAGIKLVAIPGNHETQNDKKLANVAAENRWLAAMAPYIAGSNGPKPGTSDSLQTDQSRLTYSFDFKTAHFILIDTDPTGRDWRVPSAWITADAAAANSAGKKVFAIGHKPAYPYNYATGGTDGLNTYPANRDQFWSGIENNHAVAMFCAHNHVYRRLRPNSKTWMVISGNGGSPLETDVAASEHFYGFTLVQVMKSGAIIEKSYGRDIPAAGYSAACPASTYPTTVRDSANLAW